MNRYLVQFWYTDTVCIVRATDIGQALVQAAYTGLKPKNVERFA